MPPAHYPEPSLDALDLALGQLALSVAHLAALLNVEPANRRLSQTLLRLGRAPISSFQHAQKEAALEGRTSHLTSCARQLVELGRWLAQITSSYHGPPSAVAAACQALGKDILLQQLAPLLSAFGQQPPSRRPAA